MKETLESMKKGASIPNLVIKAKIDYTTFISDAEEWKGDGINRSLEAAFQELS